MHQENLSLFVTDLFFFFKGYYGEVLLLLPPMNFYIMFFFYMNFLFQVHPHTQMMTPMLRLTTHNFQPLSRKKSTDNYLKLTGMLYSKLTKKNSSFRGLTIDFYRLTIELMT